MCSRAQIGTMKMETVNNGSSILITESAEILPNP